MKNLSKLSMAAAISVGVLSIGNLAQANTITDSQGIIQVKHSSCDNSNPTSYGAGAAGTFKTYGTENAQPAAGSTEISTSNSQTGQPSGSTAALAAQGIYGNCPSCQQAAPACKQVTPVCPTGGASEIITVPSSIPSCTTGSTDSTVATPTDSNLTGGAAAAESQGMKCTSEPVIPPSATGAAIPLCPAPACIPQADPNAPDRRANAPSNFQLQSNPGALAPIQKQQCPSGCAAPVQVAPPCPCNPAPATMIPIIPVTPIMVAPPTVQPCIQKPLSQMYQVAPSCTTSYVPVAPMMMPAPIAQPCVKAPATYPATVFPSVRTGGASSISAPISGSCAGGSSKNTKYVERQIYDYPSIPGANNVIGASNQILSFGDQLKGFGTTTNMPTTASTLMPTNITGAASPIIVQGTNPQEIFMSGGAASILTTGAAACGCGQVYSTGTPVSSMFTPEGCNTAMSIQTSSGYKIQKLVVTPGCAAIGGAAPIMNQFADISSGYWASNDINRLASSNVVAGYPDRTFKPNLPVSRAELSSMLVSGLNLQNTPAFSNQVFKDVPQNYWASKDIDKAYNRGLVNGYPDNTFKPNNSVTIAEALTVMSKSIPGDMTVDQANQILREYNDSASVPNWAVVPIAKSLKSGLTRNFPSPNQIDPNQTASRAQIAAMLSNLRQSLALEPPTKPGYIGAAANIQEESITVPTLNVKFNGRITARASHVGDKFDATTLEPITINGETFPSGSLVKGKIVEVIRPTANNPGALKVAFTDIQDGKNKAPLPRDIISARVMSQSGPGVFSRIVEFPFVWTGRLVGVAGRTVSGASAVAGNATEQSINGLGLAASNLTSREWGQAGKTAAGSGLALAKGTFDVAVTALNGASGLLNVSTDELSFLVNPAGVAVASINPKETVTVAFGCQQ